MNIEDTISLIKTCIDNIYKENRLDDKVLQTLIGNILDTAKAVSIDEVNVYNLNNILKDLLFYMEQGDIVGIRDTLEFELKDFIEHISVTKK